jgi:twitching motility protein PilT
MAAIDGLLTLLEMERTDGLSLTAGKPPSLTQAGANRALTMPPLDGASLAVFLDEIIPEDKKARLAADGAVELSYLSPRVGPVTIKAKGAGATLSLKITRGVSAGSAAAPPPGSDAAGASRSSGPAAAASVTTAVAPASPPPAPVAPVVNAAPLGAAAPSSATAPPAGLATTLVAPLPAADPAAIASLWRAVRLALRRGASDLWLSTSAAPSVRVAGAVEELTGDPVPREALMAFFGPALSPAHLDHLARTGSADFAFEAAADKIALPQSRRFRVNLFGHLTGLTAAVRPLWDRIPSAAELNLPSRILQLAGAPSGLLLVTGLTGSGKSSTLAVMVEHLNQTAAKHVVTLEDPIEYVFQKARSVIHQREVGTHVESFASGLKAALRESPDVVLVGEMRDRESVALALTAAETGHLVISTLHSAQAATAIDRIIDVFPENQQQAVRPQLASVLRAVVTQRLVPGRSPGERVPVLEILNVNYAVQALIREGKSHQIPNQMQVGADEGMVTHDRSVVELYRKGLITAATALEVARDRDQVQGQVGSMGGRDRDR